MDALPAVPPPVVELGEIERASPLLPALIPQAHGGALFTGGVPGNRGGSGRPPKRLKIRAKELLEKVIERLERKVDDERLGVTGLSEMARTLKAVAGDDTDELPPGLTAVARMSPEEMQRELAREAEERAVENDTGAGEREERVA